MSNNIKKSQKKSLQDIQLKVKSLANTILFRDIHLSPQVQYRVNMLRVIILSNLIMLSIMMLLGFFGLVSNDLDAALLALITMSLNLWAFQRVNLGDTQFAGRLVIGMSWVALAIAAYASGGIYSSTMMGFMILLVTGLLLLDKRAKRIFFASTVSYFICLYLIEISGNLPTAPFKDLPLRIFVLVTTASILFSVVSYHLYAMRQSEKIMAELRLENERGILQRNLTQDLTHDLRTPISVLKTTTYLINKRQQKGLPIEDSIQLLEAQANKLNDMIEDLFQLTFLEKADPDRTLNIVKIPNLIDACVAESSAYASRNNITIHYDAVPIDCDDMLGDYNQLRRVFNNLIENAIHYGKEGGYLKITIKNDADDNLVLQFIDDGIGIAPDDQKRIFERFYRVNDARTTREKTGTGIGLNTVARVVQLHNGSIKVDSALNKGSTFTITFPSHEGIKSFLRAAMPA
ncbi:MAG: HAMP domain-containing sensor histidine kinase [Phototrophicaceae bacterium]